MEYPTVIHLTKPQQERALAWTQAAQELLQKRLVMLQTICECNGVPDGVSYTFDEKMSTLTLQPPAPAVTVIPASPRAPSAPTPKDTVLDIKPN